MEVVIAASIIAQVSVIAIDKFTARYDAVTRLRETNHEANRHQDESEPQRWTRPQTQAASISERQVEMTEQNLHVDPQVEAIPDEHSIEFLEHRLMDLRNQARQLNAPDTLVQYARVTREANKVEKALNEKKAEKAPSAKIPLETAPFIGALSELIKPGVGVVRHGVTSNMVRNIPRIVAFLFLWYYFSWRPDSANQGIAMTVDCRALRPISFLFRKLSPACLEDDWICVAQASQTPQCVISYSWALILCNMFISALLHA
ncbi:unnamed protein product [Agarophyton chilense]